MDFSHLRKTAVGTAILKGFSKVAEDFAQEVALNEISGRHTTMNNHLVDYLRKEFGDIRYLPGQSKASALLNPIEVTDNTSGFYEQGNDMDYETIINSLSAREQAYMNLIHRWGFTLNEVGQTFGVSEGRVSQEVKEINRKLKKAIEHPNLLRGNA